jgi:hypothetical protein
MLDTKFTESQMAFEYLAEARKELIKLVNEQANSAKFWHDRHHELAKKILILAGLPDDFNDAGTEKAFQVLEEKLKEK